MAINLYCEYKNRLVAAISIYVKSRAGRILDKYMQLPELAIMLVGRSFLNDKMKRLYLRTVNERIARFTRVSRVL